MRNKAKNRVPENEEMGMRRGAPGRRRRRFEEAEGGRGKGTVRRGTAAGEAR